MVKGFARAEPPENSGMADAYVESEMGLVAYIRSKGNGAPRDYVAILHRAELDLPDRGVDIAHPCHWSALEGGQGQWRGLVLIPIPEAGEDRGGVVFRVGMRSTVWLKTLDSPIAGVGKLVEQPS